MTETIYRDNPDMELLFRPRSVAVIGIPKNLQKTGGYAWIDAMKKLGYKGRIYPVSSTVSKIEGLTVYRNISDIPEEIDLAIVSVPAQIALKHTDECVAKGVKFIHIYTAGFAETGNEQDAALETGLLEIAKTGRSRIVGPNCMGAYCPGYGVGWRLDLPTESGAVSIMSQSGMNMVEIAHRGDMRGIRFNKLINYGNACDLNESDFLIHLAADSKTKVIAAYIEGTKDGPRFLKALREVTKTKPVLILKGGRTNAGARAIASHSASLASDKKIWDSALRQAGAITIENFDDYIDTIAGFATLSPPKNNSVGIIGPSGGMCVLATDQCEDTGLFVPELSTQIQTELHTITPMAGTSIRNPVDTPIGITPANFKKTIELVSESPQIGSLILHFETESLLEYRGREATFTLIQAIVKAAQSCDKPIALVLRTAGSPEAMRTILDAQAHLLKANVVTYTSIRSAAHALGNLAHYYSGKL